MFFKNVKQKKRKTTRLQRFQPLFITVDGVKHEGTDRYNWANSNSLRCTVPEYLMIDINSNGYIKDKNSIMYPLSNVLSIEWILLEEKIVLDDFDHEYQIFFDNNEVSKMTEYLET